MVHLYKSLLDTIKFGYKANIVEDSFKNSISNIGLIYKSILLGHVLSRVIERNDRRPVGLMLPNSVPTVIVFFAIQYLNKTVAILNFTSGSKNILSCVKKTDVKYVITSKKFIEQNKMDDEVYAMKSENCKFILLEDMKESVLLKDKLLSIKIFYNKITSNNLYPYEHIVAVILITSGTESEPKSVGLTHENFFVNRKQVLKTLNISRKEKFFTCLPFFHSFGLGIGVLLPILSGCKVFLHPTPLHFQTIPELLEDTKSTVFFSTDTFLKKYLPHVNKSTFNNLKYLIAGAEKVDSITHEKYLEFGAQILEGYGVTEASPAISVNTHANYRVGSVGKFLPGIEHKIKNIEGYDKGGLLYIKGGNVINKYLGQSKEFEWYNTGDVVYVDDDGYLFILGRLKRFAKIAGEMVSLVQVEEFPKKLWPENNSVVCAIKDLDKGEALMLLTDNKNADLATLVNSMKNKGLSNLYFPRKIKIIDEFPILGSGKLDFKKLQDIAEN